MRGEKSENSIASTCKQEKALHSGFLSPLSSLPSRLFNYGWNI